MSFFYGRSEPEKIGLNVLPDTGEEIGFVEAIPKAYKTQVRARNTDTYEYLLREQMDPILEVIEERSGEKFINPGLYVGASDTRGQSERSRNQSLNKIIKHIKANEDLYPEYQDLSPETIDLTIKEIAKVEIEASEKDAPKLTTAGVVGDFIGGTGGVLVDQNFFELNLLTLGINAPAQTLARTLFRDAVVGAGTEAILQAGVKDWYDEIGVDYTWGDFVGNVAAGGVGGAVLPQAFRYGGKGLKAGVSLTNDQLRKGLVALRDAGYIKKKDADIINDLVDDAEIVAERPPSFVGDEAAQELKDRISKAIDAANKGDDAVAVATTPINPKPIEAPLDEITGMPKNQDGTVTLYHATDAKSAAAIVETQTLRSAAEPSVYMSTAKSGTGYGDVVVAVDIRPDVLRLDDEFPDGRMDFAVDAPKKEIAVVNARVLTPSVEADIAAMPEPKVAEDVFDPEAHIARAEKATADLYAGRLPEVEGNPEIDISAPEMPDIDLDSLTAIADNWKALSNDIADDDLVYFDNDAGDPIEFSGSQIKQEIDQDDTMLERLKGCVIR